MVHEVTTEILEVIRLKISPHSTVRKLNFYYKRGILIYLVHETATYRYQDTRGCVMQFWPADDEHMCSKHVEAWNKLILKQNFLHEVG